MDAQRAQDLLRHIMRDEDYGKAMFDKLPLDDAIAVEEDLLNSCIKGANEKSNANDSAFFTDIKEAFRPLLLDKIRKADHLWMVYSDVTGYPYSVDGDVLVIYDYAGSKAVVDRLNGLGYRITLSAMDPVGLEVEVSHMYRNGYKNIRFISDNATPFIASREEIYPYERFLKEDYVTNPGLSQAMISLFQETRKEMEVPKGAPEEAFKQMIMKRQQEYILNLKGSEFMVPCVKSGNDEEEEISFQCIDVTDRVSEKNGEPIIAIPIFTDGFEMEKCYPGQYEDVLCTFEEIVDTVDELGASGVIIDALGISQYVSTETLKQILK